MFSATDKILTFFVRGKDVNANSVGIPRECPLATDNKRNRVITANG
jgi:hypothetical protein